MADMPIIKNVQRDDYVFELKPWKSIHNTITKPMVTGLGPGEIKESALAMGFAYITAPDVLGSPTHVHPFDQWIYLIGADVSPSSTPSLRWATRSSDQLSLLHIHPQGHEALPARHQTRGQALLFVDASITRGLPSGRIPSRSTRRPTYQAPQR